VSLEKAVKGVEATWTLMKIGVVLFLVVWFIVSKIGAADSDKPKAFADYLAAASPIETAQRYTLNKHTMPALASVLPAVTEAERLAHPEATAIQLQRAKWIERTWQDAERRGEEGRKVNGGEKGMVASVLGGVVSEAMGKPADKSDVAGGDLAKLQLLVGDAVVPSLASGKLPVFGDADWAKVKAEEVKQGVTWRELDYRRALWFVVTYGAGNKPAPAAEDAEIRAAEAAAEKDRPKGGGLWSAPTPPAATAPLSENERMAKAVDVLNIVYAAQPGVSK